MWRRIFRPEAAREKQKSCQYYQIWLNLSSSPAGFAHASGDADDNQRCIVDPRIVDRAFSQNFNNLPYRPRRGHGIGDVTLPQTVDETVRANQQAVTRFNRHYPKVRTHLRMSPTNHLIQRRSPWVAAELDLANHSTLPAGPCSRMIDAQLAELARPRKIDPRVANIGKIEIIWREPGQRQRRRRL